LRQQRARDLRTCWPNFEQNCQFDFINPSNEARIVRVIAIK